MVNLFQRSHMFNSLLMPRFQLLTILYVALGTTPQEEVVPHEISWSVVAAASDVGIVGNHGNSPPSDEEIVTNAIASALTDWQVLDGPLWQVISNDETTTPFDRYIAFRKALALMGTLIIRYPSIPAAEVPGLVGFPLFCSESNFAEIRFEDNVELDRIRSAMYERDKRSESVDALNGLAEWGSLCPDLINDTSNITIELRGLILMYRAIRGIPDQWKRVHITVSTVGAFHDSKSLLLGPVAVLLEGRFSVTTKTSAGNSEEIHDWFVAIKNDLGSSPFTDKALGRFLALCILYDERILWQIPSELAEAIVRGNGPNSSAADGFHDLISSDKLLDITGEELISIIHGFGNKDPVVPFLGSVPDADLSSLGLSMRSATPGLYKNAFAYLREKRTSKRPLDRWTRAGGPELLRLSYSQPTALRLWLLMVLFADSRANAKETGIKVFCETHQIELEELLVDSVLNESEIKEVLFSSRATRRTAVASKCFAADWFTQCPSVLASSSYLKGIALSHMLFRDIAYSSGRATLRDGLFRSMFDIPSVYNENFWGSQIGIYMLYPNAAAGPAIPLSAFEAALSGQGPVAAGFATVIPPASTKRFARLGITPGLLQEMVFFNPTRINVQPQTETRIELIVVRKVIASLYFHWLEKAFWDVCNLLLKAVGPIEDAELRVVSSSIGLNKVCIDRPGYCRSALGSFESTESTEFIDMVVQKLPSLFPEFWTANRVDLTAVLIRARHKHSVAHVRDTTMGIGRIEVHRDNVLKDSWKWLSEGRFGSHLRLVSATFVDELGTGPGVFADWFTLLASELGQKVLQLRTELPQYYVPNPMASRAELVALGRLLGLALVFEKPIPLGLPLMLFAGLLPDYTDYFATFAKDDPTVFASYQTILGMDENVLNLATFEINSVTVTVADRAQLIEDAIRGPFQGIVMERILDGFSDIVPPEAFSHTGITSPSELQLLIQGVADVDIDDMQAHVGEYVGYTSNDDQIVWLFSFLEASDLETRRNFLHFVTGLNAVGVGGFLTNPINIQYISGEDTRLPSSHTCSRMLDLPKYSSRAILEEKLTIAINADLAMGTT